jgi:transcription initiation factor IIE alpha subunit
MRYNIIPPEAITLRALEEMHKEAVKFECKECMSSMKENDSDKTIEQNA